MVGGHMWDMDQGSRWQHLHRAVGSDFLPITFLYKPWKSLSAFHTWGLEPGEWTRALCR